MFLNTELLEQSFERIKPQASAFAASFYENLFQAHPEVKPLFAATDMTSQQKKLLNALVLVVENLRHPNVLKEVLSSLGNRHVKYGAIPQYYAAVGHVLLRTLEQYLQHEWSPELKQAWANAYEVITTQMLQGAANVHSEEERSRPETQTAVTTSLPFHPSITDPSTQPKVEKTSRLGLSELPMELLEKSFETVKPHAEEFAVRFYKNLFQAHPEVKPLFANVNIAQQQKKLLNSLVLVVENLRHPDALRQVLNGLGARHVGYGAVPNQYAAVGQALLTTLEQQLQTEWTPELKQAWTDAFNVISDQMLQGADQMLQSGAQRSKPAVPSVETEIPLPIRESRRDLKLLKRQSPTRRWSASPRQVVKSLTDMFWRTPTWVIAAVVVVVMGAIFWEADPDSQFARVLGGISAIAVVVGLVLFIKESPDRKKQFHYQAWSVIDAAYGVKVSYARIMALQDLNADGVPLRGLDAPGAECIGIQLAKADLSQSNLDTADLSNANLSHANFSKANLHQTKLSGADLSHANFSFAQLIQANLSSANLSSANLLCADLSSANLSGTNLRNANLSGANLTGTYLIGANLKGAKVTAFELEAALLKNATMPDGSYRS